VILALAMALAVNTAMPVGRWPRMAYFTPTMLPMIAVGQHLAVFFTPDYGLFDHVIELVRRRAAQLARRSGNRRWPSMIVVAVWKEAGFFMIFYLAALQAMPPI
jgi:sn-glycerol 3-phosphate transport system permease protein